MSFNKYLKVCILTTVHSPFDVRIFHKEAKSLVRASYDVTLIAQHDKEEIVDGIKIINLQRPHNRIERMTKTVWEAYRKAREIDADIYHFHDPELLPIGLLLKCYGKQVIYDIHEDVPKDIQHKLWIPPKIRNIVSKLIYFIEVFTSKVISGLISATPSIAARFPQNKTVVIQNYPILNERIVHKVNHCIQRPVNIVYTGIISELYGPKEMVKAIEFIPDYLHAKLILAGAFSPSSLIDELCQMPGWARVDFLGWISREAVLDVFDNARIGLVLYHPAPNHIESQPNKMFEYMAAGLPVIASNFPLWKEIIEKNKCGICVNPLNPEEIAAAINRLLQNPAEADSMGRNGRNAILEKFNWELESQKLIRFYEELLK